MFNGLKTRQKLAAYVALGLSTGGGLLFSAPSAHAMDVTILPTDTAHASGVNGTAETNQKDGNNVTIGTSGEAGPVINGDVVGGSSSAADVANNKVTINSITLGSGNTVYGGQSMGGAASNNTVTINGGTLNSSNKIIGGSGTAGSTSNGNVVNLNGGSLHGAEVWGSYYGNNNTLYQSDSDKIKGNTLNVGASGLEVERLRNFEKYNFNLTEKVAAGSTMLTVGDFRAFGFRTPAEWSKITLTGKENDTDRTKYGRVGTITLMSSGSGGGLSINGYAVGGRTGTTGDYEYRLYTNNTFLGYPGDPVGANYVRADVDRYQNSDAEYNGTAVTSNTVYGGYSSLGNTANKNKLTIKAVPSGGLSSAYGAATTGTAGDSTNNTLTVESTGTARIVSVYGGAITNAANAGTVTRNTVALKNGKFGVVYGGYTVGTGTATGNTVTITGGTIGTGSGDGQVYGGYSSRNNETTGNTINLGDGSNALAAGTNLTNASLYGGNSSDVTGNTLNVKVKDAVVKGVSKFENVNFHMNSTITDGATMLTVVNGGLGGTVDWEKVKVLAESLTSAVQPNREVTLLKSNAANALKFSNYNVRNLITDPNSDYEAVMRTDTEKGAGTVQSATAVTLRTNRWRNSEWTYDGTNPSTVDEVAGGISYDDNHTTYDNQITVTAVPSTNLNFVYGGKTNGAADSRENRVIVENTGNGSITNINGGFTGKADGVAEGNRVTIKGGTVTNVMGGAVSGANASATKNGVFVEGGTLTNVSGGAGQGSNGGLTPTAGNISNNFVTITGGTVSGFIIGGDSRVTTSTSNHNTVTLGGGTLTGSQIWGTSYNGNVFANDSEKLTGNTLDVQAANLTVKKVRNFEKYKFTMTDKLKDGDTMLTLSEAGGFGKLSSDNSDVKVKWSNVSVDLPTDLTKASQGKNTITLLKAASTANDLKFDGYTETGVEILRGVYEKKLATNTNTGAANSVVLELNRFKDGTVTHDGTTSPAEVYGGYSAYDHTERDADGHEVTVGTIAEGNTLKIEGVKTGTTNLKAYGGYAKGAQGGAVNNRVHVDVKNANAGSLDTVVGGYASGANAGAVHHNTLHFSQGATLKAIMAGFIDSQTSTADVSFNTVTVEGGEVSADIDGGAVYGGRTNGKGKAEHNTVNLLGGTVNGIVVGGYSDTAPAAGVNVANDNTINLYATTVNGAIVGGAAKDSHGDKVVNGIGNTLAVHARGAKAHDFLGVQNLHFYIPAGTTADPAAATMLRLTNVGELSHDNKKDLSNINVRVGLAGSRPTLHVGDTVSLMKTYKVDGGNSKAVEIANAPSLTNAEGMHGISLRYKFNLLTREALNEADAATTNADHKRNELVAEVAGIEVNDQTKSLVETRAATTAMINSAADLLTDNGFRAAEEAISAQNLSAKVASVAANAVTNNGFQMWAAQGGSSMRLNSGSYVDAKGWNLNLGFAKQKVAGRNTLTYGPMIEYGRGSYDSYLDGGTHGDGSMDYLGLGVMAKSKNESGLYVEGSLRAGRVKSDYSGNIDNTGITYDSSSTYYGIHLGVGQEKELKGGDTIDTYAKYFYSHQASDTVKISTGETYEFDAVDSHRIRIGARYTKKLSGGSAFYTGLAYEYEFGSEAGATFDGYSTPSPSLKGSTGILELGYRFAPKNERVSYGVNLMGMTGKRKGISGGVQINWAF